MRNALTYLTAALLITTPVLAQNLGTLQGEARDALNLSPLVGWEVDVIQGDFQLETIVDDAGNFIFEQLPTGLYNVRAKSPKGQMQTLHEVQVRSSKPTYVSLLVEHITSLDEVAVRADAFHRTPETPLSIKNIGRFRRTNLNFMQSLHLAFRTFRPHII